jgi:hypothetical protein
MRELNAFNLKGDHHDLPLLLGLVVMSWNSCESNLRELIRAIATRHRLEDTQLIDVLVSEMGTLGLTQAIRCYADEVPPSEPELAAALIHSAALTERLKPYRNYYVHGMQGVTRYGVTITDELLDRDAPWHEALQEGSFANIYQRSAKGRSKFVMDFVDAKQLTWLAEQLEAAVEYTRSVGSAFKHFLGGNPWRETAPLPEPPPLPDVLVKPELRHPKLKKLPALTPLADRPTLA